MNWWPSPTGKNYERLRQIAFTNWNVIWLSQLIGVYGIWRYTLNTANERFRSKKATVTKQTPYSDRNNRTAFHQTFQCSIL
jgi:hypothetical protein